MEGLLILAIVIGGPILLAMRAIRDARLGRDMLDPMAPSQAPRPPVMPTHGRGWAPPGSDFIDDPTGDAGARPRVD